MKKNLLAVLLLLAAAFAIQTGCKKESTESIPSLADESATTDYNAEQRGVPVILYNSNLATAWIKMQLQVMKTASGIPHVAFGRPYVYSSIAFYEALVNGMPFHRSLDNQLNGMPAMPNVSHILKYNWPCAGNAAMASILKKMYPTTSAANVASIDSLENVFNALYSSTENANTISRSVTFGRDVAQAVYDWSETDGYQNASASYTPPVGPGLWVPTPPAFGPASTPYWGNVRSLIASSGNNAQPVAPVAYSEVAGSPFYNMVLEVYNVSQTLTQSQTDQAVFWRDLPGPTVFGHYLSILEQVIEAKNPSLAKSAVANAYTAIIVYDAAISTWQTKYNYNLVRPVTYIRKVIGDTTWNSLLTTPGHPEYSSAHAVLSIANAEALTDLFGNNYSFTDHTNDYLGQAPRTFTNFIACGEDAGNSRLYAGIHYQPSIDIGFVQGRKVHSNIKQTIKFRKGNCNGPF